VGGSSRHEDEATGGDWNVAVAKPERGVAVCDVERLVRVRVDVQRRRRLTRRKHADHRDIGALRVGRAKAHRLRCFGGRNHSAPVDGFHRAEPNAGRVHPLVGMAGEGAVGDRLEEPEVVGAATLARFADDAHERDTLLRGWLDQQQLDERLGLEQQLTRARELAGRRGIDGRNDVRLIGLRIASIMRKAARQEDAA
jgi:hypothetical protein